MYASKYPSGANAVAPASDSKAQQPNSELPIRDVEGQQFERVQNFSQGDSRINNSDKARSPPGHPERFDAGEHMRQLDRQSSCQCKLHPEMQNQAPRPETSQQQGRGGASFTPEMLKDQEYLVTSMSQQGIPEPLIRRQFERLLEEQGKQMRLLEPSAAAVPVERKPSSRRMRQAPGPAVARVEPCVVPETSYSRPEPVAQPTAPMQYYYQQPQQQQQYWHPDVRADQQQEQPSLVEAEPQQLQHAYHQHYHQQQHHHQAPQPQQQVGGDAPAAPSSVTPPANDASTEDSQIARRQRLVEPSTLVRLRREKEQALARAKNNGLQDLDASPALEALAKSRAEASKQRATQLRLNGAQDHDEMGEQLHLLPDFDIEAYTRAQQQAASRACRSNGLENSRSPSNPTPTRRSLQALKARQRLADAEEIVPCYPPQKAYMTQSQPQQHQVHQQQQQQQQVVEREQAVEQHQQQMYQQEEHQQQQQQHQQWQMMQTQQIYEPREIGGFLYMARKPSCVDTMPCTSTYANCCAPHSHHCTSTVG